MRIKAAWTVKMQSLANDADVIAVVDAAAIPGALGTIASLISKHSSLDDNLDAALAGALRLLPALLQSASSDEEFRASEDMAVQLATTITETVRRLYANAASQDELHKRRGKVVELTIYRHVSQYYDADECMADCLVEPTVRNEYYDDITGHEFDLCAWSEHNLQGEAYECSVRPYGLQYSDCTALISLWYAVSTENDDDDLCFTLGLVSFDHSKYLRQRVKKLAGNGPQVQEEFDWLSLYGYDNINDLTG